MGLFNNTEMEKVSELFLKNFTKVAVNISSKELSESHKDAPEILKITAVREISEVWDRSNSKIS